MINKILKYRTIMLLMFYKQLSIFAISVNSKQKRTIHSEPFIAIFSSWKHYSISHVSTS